MGQDVCAPELDRTAFVEVFGQAELPLSWSAVADFKPLSADLIARQVAEQTIFALGQPSQHLQASTGHNWTGLEDFVLDLDGVDPAAEVPIRLTGCRHFLLRGTGERLELRGQRKFFLLLEDCTDFCIEGLDTLGGRNPLLIRNSQRFVLRGLSMEAAEGFGIILQHCSDFSVDRCVFLHNLAAGLMLLGNCAIGWIRQGQFRNSRGFLNQDAGLHLCASSAAIGLDEIPEACHEALPITQKSCRPRQLLIEQCVFSGCRAQGLYLEGALNNLIRDNLIMDNNKEGVCFDWGSNFNLFLRNQVLFNGARLAMSAEEIAADFIADYPLLEDGSSSMKLPGVSLDNSSANLLAGNRIMNNQGGGIKCIRACFCNAVNDNEIVGNHQGSNRYLRFFHGVTLLGLGAVNGEFTGRPDRLLDFLPSAFNSFRQNRIVNHWLPVYADALSAPNQFEDNQSEPAPGPWQRCVDFFNRFVAHLRRKSFKMGPL
jgi:hypothetical protein